MIYNIKDYGAIADAETLNNESIQAAIDACFENGGGRVLVEGGVYMFSTLTLRSNVELHIAAGATLLGSPEMEDYIVRDGVKHVNSELLPRWKNTCYIFCEESENIAITGQGRLDCNGQSFVRPAAKKNLWKYERMDGPTPPRVVFFTGCTNIKIEDVTMVNQPAGWSYWIHDCDYVTFDKVTIMADVEYPNNDGIHINSSRNVNISNCNIICGDDCIVVRANNVSLAENKVCERVTVMNCNLTSYASGIRIAWKNDGVIKNCVFSNIVMTDTSVGVAIQLPSFKFDPEQAYTSDMGREATLVENLSFNNIVMDGVYGPPISIAIGVGTGTLVEAIRNIYFSNVYAKGACGLLIEGRENNHIDNVKLSNCTFEITDYSIFDGRTAHGGQNASKNHGSYPKISYCDRLVLDNVELQVKN